MIIRSALPFVIAIAPLLGAQDKPEADSVVGRGQEISSAVSSVTSTSVSPLLGVTLFGAYQYVKTPAASRGSLPFYARPRVWITLAVLLTLIFLKDTIGGAVPLLKKPLDALEVLIVNKASLVLLALPFMFDQVLPLVGLKSAGRLVSMFEPVAYAGSGLIQTAGNVGVTVLMIAAGIITTIVVWLVGHAIDVLVLLSPFPFVDVLFKGFRAAIVLAILVASMIDRRAGLFISLAVIAVAVLLFSWALRFAILGSVFAWDLLRFMVFASRGNLEREGGIPAFTAARIRGVPKQTFGTLTRDPNGILEFRCRRLGFGPARRIRLDDAICYEVGRGLLYPCVILPNRTGSGYALQFRLTPRYMGAEERLRSKLGMAAIRDIRLRKGLQSFLDWIEGTPDRSRFTAERRA